MCDMDQWPSGRVSASAFCSCWFDLQWWRSRYALLMRLNKVETAVQCSVCRRCLPDFLIMIIQIYIYIYIYIVHIRRQLNCNYKFISAKNIIFISSDDIHAYIYLANSLNGWSVHQWFGREGFNPRSSHTKDSKSGTWCLLA